MHETLELHASIGMIAREAPGRHGGKGHRFLEAKSGDFPSADGTWSKVVQVVNRRTNQYRKWVQRANGTVTRDVDEPLDQHRGYGSAKARDAEQEDP